MDKNFGGVVWTNHVLQRMRERGIKQGDAWATWRNPDRSHYARLKGTWVYERTWENQHLEVVAKQNEKKEWLILSVWQTKPQASQIRPSKFFSRLLNILFHPTVRQ